MPPCRESEREREREREMKRAMMNQRERERERMCLHASDKRYIHFLKTLVRYFVSIEQIVKVWP